MVYALDIGLPKGARELSNKISSELLAKKHVKLKNDPNNIHSYPAKMIKSIPEVIIPRFSNQGDIILDPFCGSGTVLLESKLHQRNAIGLDVNPLAVLISNVKTKDIRLEKISYMKAQILKKAKLKSTKYKLNFPNKDYWFTKSAQRQLEALFVEINNIDYPIYKNFFLLCLSGCVRYASRADPEIIPPVISKRMKVGLRNKRAKVIKKFSEIVDKNASALATISQNNKNLNITALVGDARNMPIESNTINLVLTSPPYISAQKYARSLKLELFWTGLISPEEFAKIDSETIGTERVSINKDFSNIKIKDKNLANLLNKIKKVSKKRYVITLNYFANMEQSIKEIYRVIKPGGYFILLIGENSVCGIKIPNGKILTEYAIINGFELVTVTEDNIKTYGFMTRRNKTAGIIDKEEIIIFQKVQ